jgi:hypothetical protein
MDVECVEALAKIPPRENVVHLKTTMNPVARELAPAGLRSSPKPFSRMHPDNSRFFTTAAQPSGSKLPRHGFILFLGKEYLLVKGVHLQTSLQADPLPSRAGSLPQGNAKPTKIRLVSHPMN